MVINMDLHGISSIMKNQAAYTKSDSQSSQDTDGNDGGWKYLTVRANGKLYTYIVIGKNMRVLIGETTDKEAEDKDKKTASTQNSGGPDQTNGTDKTAASGSSSSDKLAADGQNGDGKKEETVKADFLTDTSMLGLTSYYQKKTREMLKTMEENIGNSEVAIAESGTNTR
jgi:hypothetical protein